MKKTTSIAFAIYLLLGMAATSPSADEFYETGLAKLEQGQFLAAIGNFTEAVSLNPNHADAYLQRANAKEWLAQQQGYTATEHYADLLKAARLGKTQALTTISEGFAGECVTELQADLQVEEVFCLDISGTDMKTIPVQVGSFTDLIRLNVSNNRLTELNGIFARNQSMLFLDARQNKIRNLSAGIRNLSFLRELDLSENELETLPSEMAQLKNLRILNLSGNMIPDAEQDRIRELLPNCSVYFHKSENVVRLQRSPKFRANRKAADSQAGGKVPHRF